MRSSNKSRSRNKNNNNNRRSSGNVVNRVFDSSGPEGKVRGTPQQIIEKYQALAQDAQRSGDRIGAESFLQHCEHYTRMLSEAMREQAARREQHEAQQNQHQQQRRDNQQNEKPSNAQNETQPDTVAVSEQPSEAQPVIASEDSGLVETPESKPRPRKRKPQPRPDKPVQASEQPVEVRDDAEAAPEANAAE